MPTRRYLAPSHATGLSAVTPVVVALICAAASDKPLVLTGEVTVRCEANPPAVSLAVGDLLADLTRYASLLVRGILAVVIIRRCRVASVGACRR